MKTLTLLRHCKSDWSFGDLSDHDRPLNKRGKRDIPNIAGRLNVLDYNPDVCFHSSARRAKDTANGVLEYLDFSVKLIETDDLYVFDFVSLHNFIMSVPDKYDNILLVAHNPGLTDLINFLGDVKLDNLPTGGYCQYQFDLGRWEDIDEGKGMYTFLEYPKMFKAVVS